MLTILFTRVVISQTIPTDHWVYGSIRNLQQLGYFETFQKGSIPYTQEAIISELYTIQESGQSNLPPHPELELLYSEFSSNLQKYVEKENGINSDRMVAESELISRSSRSHSTQFGLSGRAAYKMNPSLIFQYGFTIDQAFNNDSTYEGYEWRGFTGSQDQMSISFHNESLKLLFGREYQSWGYGNTGRLFISDNSRPFDMVKLSVNADYFFFETFVAQLDQLFSADRYLTASRLALEPFGRFTLGLGQSALYGGPGRPVDFTLSNPLSFYSFSQDNDKKYMNGMLYADMYFPISHNFNIYSELLIDDFQIDHREKADLEPNEIAFILGAEGVQLWGKIDWWSEFVQVRNRTYNVPEIRPWEKFLHKGSPIAHAEGNDFQLFASFFKYWIHPRVNIYSKYKYIHKGEGTIKGIFDEPWMEEGVTIETGYSEKYPSGLLMITREVVLGAHWFTSQNIQINASLGYQSITNMNHILHNNKSGILASFMILGSLRTLN
jgi:hypothetical protein